MENKNKSIEQQIKDCPIQFYPLSYRLTINIDGKEMLGTSINLKAKPENEKELAEVLKEIVESLEAPEIEDKKIF